MDMPEEVRIGRHVPDAMQTVAKSVVAAVHARLPLSSARIYKLSGSTYKLSILPEGRTTLVTLDFRIGDRVATRADAVIELVRQHSDQLDRADARNALPIQVERAVAAYVHEAGDGAWFRTAVRHAARRTQLCRDRKGVVPAWPEVRFGMDDVMRPEGPAGIRFTGAGTPGLVGLRLTLPGGTPVLRPFGDVAGVPADELVDHPLVNGAGLTAVKAWKSETDDRALGRVTITLASDPIALDDAATLVDRMRTANGRRGVSSFRTNFRAADPGYAIPDGCQPEDPRRFSWEDAEPLPVIRRGTVSTMPDATAVPAPQPTIAKPSVTRGRELESLLAFVRSKGLEREWIATLAAEEDRRDGMRTPAVTVSRQEREGRRYFDTTINITPWLVTAAVEDVIQLVALDYEDLRDGSDARIFLDGVCDACEGYRDDGDDEHHIEFPDEWDYDVWGEHLRAEVIEMVMARRPEIHARIEQACQAAATREDAKAA